MAPLLSKLLAGSCPAILSLLALTGSSNAHSWVEQMQEVDKTGAYTSAMGYPRGYVSRTQPGFDGNSMDYLLPALVSDRTRINASDLLCHPSQRVANQTSGYPMLTTSPGNFIAMKYLENGHVTLPDNQLGKPQGGGTVFVFGTTNPSSTEKISDVLNWTADGSGGNGRGRLLTAQNFDDGRCHQLNSGAISQQRQQEFPDRLPGQPNSNVEQWCETDVPVPTDQATGQTLTLYWVWQWPTAPGADPILPNGKDEYYTTCADVQIVAAQANTASKVTVNVEALDRFALNQQDPQTKAVANFADRTAIKANPLGSGSASSAPNSAPAANHPPVASTSPIANKAPAATAVTGVTSRPAATIAEASPAADATTKPCEDSTGAPSQPPAPSSTPAASAGAGANPAPSPSPAANAPPAPAVPAASTVTATETDMVTVTATTFATLITTVTEAPTPSLIPAITPSVVFTTIYSTTHVPAPAPTGLTVVPVPNPVGRKMRRGLRRGWW